MSSNPPKPTPPPPAPPREPWPEIDRLTADASVRMPTCAGWYLGIKVGLDYTAAVMMLPFAVFLVARYQSEVAELIESTVAAWDPELTSRRVELAIGRDLQFIRINGTIVGGLAGMLIYLISSLFP